MKRTLTLIIFLIIANQAYCQLFFGTTFTYSSYSGYEFYVDIKRTDASVKIYYIRHIPRYICTKKYDSILLVNNDSNKICFQNNEVRIIKKHDYYYIQYLDKILKKWKKHHKFKVVQLQICKNDNRLLYSKNEYYNKKKTRILWLEDSLRIPDESAQYKHHHRIWTDSTSLEDFASIIDKQTDSLTNLIINNTDTSVKKLYNAYNSTKILDSATVFKLLNDYSENYLFNDYFIYYLSTIEPAYLVQYIDKNPYNKENILLKIRYNNRRKEIIDSIKQIVPDTHGKKEIIMQNRKRVIDDIRYDYVPVIATLSVLGLLGYLIFK